MSLDTLDRFEWLLFNVSLLRPSVLCAISVGILVICCHKYKQPWNRSIHFTEIGFDHVIRSKTKNHKSIRGKRDSINRLIQNRIPGELPPPYPNGWYVILGCTDLDKNDIEEVQALGLHLVAWRGESGKVYLTDAYCSPLEAHLGIGWEVEGECIEYQGLTFDGSDGHLTNNPYPETIPVGAKIRMHNVIEGNGLIYFWYNVEDKEPSWIPPIYTQIHSGRWHLCGKSLVLVTCHIQDIIENGFDVGHLHSVHHSVALGGGSRWELPKLCWSNMTYQLSVAGEGHIAIMECQLKLSLFGKYFTSPTTVSFTQVGPGLLYIIFNTNLGRVIIMATVTPLGPLCQKTRSYIYTDSALLNFLAGKLILLVQANQYKRDVNVWNRKTHLKNPILVKEDRPIKEFRQWYSQFYSRSSPTSTQHFKQNTN